MVLTGLVVVRLPHLNRLTADELVPRLGDCIYSGVTRCMWADVFDEDFYAKRAPSFVQRAAKDLESNDRICHRKETAMRLLEYSNRNGLANELIAVRCNTMDSLSGTAEISVKVEPMGYDIMATGEWSLIEAGVFFSPDYYKEWVPRLNRFGLFDDPSLFHDYCATYNAAVEVGKSEPIAPAEAGLEKVLVEVARVLE